MLRALSAMMMSLLITAAPAKAQTPEPSDPVGASVLMPGTEEAVATVNAFHDALRRGEKTAAVEALDPSVVIFEEGYVERSRAEYEAHHLDSDVSFASASTSTVTARSASVSGDVVWVTSEGRTTGGVGERAIDRITTETMVLVRGASGWRIRHIHWSSRAP